MRRILIKVFLFFLCGVVVYHKKSFLLGGAVITALFLMVYIKKLYKLSLYCIIFLIIGMITSYMHCKTFENTYKALNKTDHFEGYIIEKDNGSYTLKNYRDKYNIVFYTYKRNDLFPGDYVKFNGRVREKPDYKKASLNSRWIDAYLAPVESTIEVSKNNNPLMLPVIMKHRINSRILSISQVGGGFICGLVSGYTGGIGNNDMLRFKELGLSHVLAVSGFNLGIVYYFLTIVTRKLHARLRYLLILLICFIYTSFAGFDPSISRAFIMVFVSLLAKILNKSYDVLNGISLTAFIMLLINSYNIFNIGFILSFAATYGIILLKDEMEDRLPESVKFLRSELSISLAAFISTLPIIVWLGGSFSLFSVIINIIISPFISILTILSFFASFVFILTGLEIFFYPAVFIGEVMVKFIQLISHININFYPGKTSGIFITAYYFFILLQFEYISYKSTRVKNSYIKCALIIVMLASLLYYKPLLKIHVINVGQGDSIFIQTPEKRSILIDTGPELYNYISARDKIIPYIKRLGYNKIDLLIITHPHSDHAGGLKYIFDSFKIDKVAVCKRPDTLQGDCVYIYRGDIINLGDVKINILAPSEDEIFTMDDNETCLIMELKYRDFSMLLTGDASKSDLDFISGSYDVLKVPHHGSIYSLSQSMLDNTRIGSAVISVGKNSFGHPSPLVIREFEKKNIGVYRTDKLGDIIIQTQGSIYSILSQ